MSQASGALPTSRRLDYAPDGATLDANGGAGFHLDANGGAGFHLDANGGAGFHLDANGADP